MDRRGGAEDDGTEETSSWAERERERHNNTSLKSTFSLQNMQDFRRKENVCMKL